MMLSSCCSSPSIAAQAVPTAIGFERKVANPTAVGLYFKEWVGRSLSMNPTAVGLYFKAPRWQSLNMNPTAVGLYFKAPFP